MDVYYPQFALHSKKYLPGLRLDALAKKRSRELLKQWSEE
jgi:hypothetical protein